MDCLDENELAQYADYLLYNASMPEVEAMNHVEAAFIVNRRSWLYVICWMKLELHMLSIPDFMC